MRVRGPSRAIDVANLLQETSSFLPSQNSLWVHLLGDAVARPYIQSFVDYLFGYDFFIAYAHADGTKYPQSLADRLTDSRFRSFLDSRDYVPGDNLDLATARRVRMSSYLIVVFRPGVLTSQWVTREVDACLAAGRKPIVIDFHGCFDRTAKDHPLRRKIEDHVRIVELDGHDENPSQETLDELKRSFKARRQEIKRRVVALILSLTTVMAIGMAMLAVRQSRVAARSDAEARERGARVSLERAITYCRQGDTPRGMTWLAHALTQVPDTAPDLEQTIRMNLALWSNEFVALQAITPDDAEVLAVAFGPDGSVLLTINRDGVGWFLGGHNWERQGEPLRHAPTVQQHIDDLQLRKVGTVGFSTNGRMVFTHLEGLLQLWDVESRRAIGPVKESASLPGFLNLSGREVLSAQIDESPRYWDLASGEPIAGLPSSVDEQPPKDDIATTRQGVDAPQTVQFASGRDREFTVVGEYRAATLLTASRPHRRITLSHAGGVIAHAFSNDDNLLATASSDGLVRVWKLPRVWWRTFATSPDDMFKSLAFSNDGRLILAGVGIPNPLDHTLGGVELWDSQTLTRIGERQIRDEPVYGIAVSPDGRRFVAGDNSGLVVFYDAMTLESVVGDLHHDGVVSSAQFNRSGDLCLTGSFDDTAKVWEVATGKLLGTLQHSADVMAVAFSPDGSVMATASRDGILNLWSVATCKMLHTPMRHLAPDVEIVSFSKTGDDVVVVSSDNSATYWVVASGARRRAIPGRTSVSIDAEFGRRLDNNRHYPSKEELGPDVLRMDVDPALRLAALGRKDRLAEIWDLVTQTQIGPSLEHGDWVTAVRFNEKGDLLLTGGEDGKAFLWELPHPMQGDADAIIRLIRDGTGLAIDAAGIERRLPLDEWRRLKTLR